MDIFGETIDRELADLAAQGVRTRFVGRARPRARSGCRRRWGSSRRRRPTRRRCSLWIAFDYGGRAELVEAARRLVEDGVEADDVDEARLAGYLYAPDMPDPDLVIRTSGELRVSNFLLWQAAYAELVFTDALWPDFGPDEFRRALEDYAGRRRRFGGR